MAYNMTADFLAKFASFTPWIQATVVLTVGSVLGGGVLAVKQMVIAVAVGGKNGRGKDQTVVTTNDVTNH